MRPDAMKIVTTLQTLFASCVVLALALGAAPAMCQADDAGKWPTSGAVEYQITVGEGGMTIGKAQHSWSHDSKQYQMQLAVQTTGLVAVLHKLDYVQKSTGSVGPDGLRPQRFDVGQVGRKQEGALFDWDNARVSIQRGGKERRSVGLTAGDQDILSVWHHFGLLNKLPESLLMVANKNARRGRVQKLETGSVQVPAGRYSADHLKLKSDDGHLVIDLWLARDQGMVPVKVIFDDDKQSGALVLQATVVRLSEQ
jgi:hypothetical protein